MDWPELEQNMALWQICLTGHMQVYVFLNCSLQWLYIISGCIWCFTVLLFVCFLWMCRWKTCTSNERISEKKATEWGFSCECWHLFLIMCSFIAAWHLIPPTILSSQRRIVMLSEEVDRGIDTWQKKQEEDKLKDEHKKSLLLKAKGKTLIKKKSQS